MEKLSREERETHILKSEADDYWLIETAERATMTKCKKQGYEVVRVEKYPDGSICSMLFKAPSRCISFLKPERKKTILTEEQKEKRRKQLATLRQ